MEYLSVVEDTYEEAVARAKELYGPFIRIHSRRDFVVPGGLFTRRQKRCEIVCYIPEQREQEEKGTTGEATMREFEEEAKTPDPTTLSDSERLETESQRDSGKERAAELLSINHVSGSLYDRVMENFSASFDGAAKAVMERIIKNVPIDLRDQGDPKHFVVFIGPTGSGKTTTCAKVACHYKEIGKRVRIITLDSYRAGAYEQAKAFGEALSIPVTLARSEDELFLMIDKDKDSDVILIDTMGIGAREAELDIKLKAMTNQIDRSSSLFVLTLPSSMKEEDAREAYQRYSSYLPDALIITKTDESLTIGGMLSLSLEKGLPLLFFTDGQRVPEDLEKAISGSLVSHLMGFGLEEKRGRSQISSMNSPA